MASELFVDTPCRPPVHRLSKIFRAALKRLSNVRRTTSLHVVRTNAPGRTRTCDLRFRKPLLCPAELRAQCTFCSVFRRFRRVHKHWRTLGILTDSPIRVYRNPTGLLVWRQATRQTRIGLTVRRKSHVAVGLRAGCRMKTTFHGRHGRRPLRSVGIAEFCGGLVCSKK